MKPLILYHGNCNDGWCAAWVAHRYFKEFYSEEAELVPVLYNQPPPNVKDRDLYILDFSYKLPEMKQIIRDCSEIVVLDHHKSAKENLQGLSEFARQEGTPNHIKFDMTKSGARLTWEHFFSKENASWLVDYTEDRDLWKFELKDSKAINAMLMSVKHDIKTWDSLHYNFNEILVNEGYGILRYQEILIENICKQALLITLDGYEVWSANTSVLHSEVAGKLSEGTPFGMTWFQRADGKRQISLRSQNDGVDVSKIAEAHGGGGHIHAAGYEILSGCENG